MELLFLFLLFHCVSPVKHRLMFMGVASSGLANFPDLLSTIVIDDTRVCYCDSTKTHSSILDKNTPGVDTDLFNLFFGLCFETLPSYFDVKLNFLKNIDQLEAVHILQIITGCEWNDATGEFGYFVQYGYNGEDLFELDFKTLTWIAKSHQAVMIKSEWETEEETYEKDGQALLTNVCPEWLKKYVVHDPQEKRVGLPSVSLLQKTPSSPIRCHVTGFYPNRGQLYWRENGEEIHEHVDHGEILPNPDGTFQMSVDVNVSSIPLEDWGKYDCVYQQPGLGNITMKLDKAVIKTNRVPPTDFSSHVISGVVIGLVLFVALCISGFIFWKKKNNGFQPANRSDQIENNSELQSFKDEARTVDGDQTSSNE